MIKKKKKPSLKQFQQFWIWTLEKRSHRWTNLSHFDIIDSFKTGLKHNLLLWSGWVSEWSGHILTRPYGLYIGFIGLLAFRPPLSESLRSPGTGLLTSTFFFFFREQVSAPFFGNPLWVMVAKFQISTLFKIWNICFLVCFGLVFHIYNDVCSFYKS